MKTPKLVSVSIPDPRYESYATIIEDEMNTLLNTEPHKTEFDALVREVNQRTFDEFLYGKA
jgi:hypothetical protein